MLIFRDIIKYIVIKNNFINKFYVKILRLKNFNTLNEIELREKLGLFEYSLISQKLFFYPIHRILDNNYYGIAHSLNSFSNQNSEIEYYIEHGLFFGSLVKNDSLNWKSKGIITFSENRKRHIQRISNRKVITIGPYIHYAKPILTIDEHKKLKLFYGKTILVFPSHSNKDLTVAFNISDLIKKVNQIKLDYCFDSVIVCLYWIDCQNIDYVNLYESHGYNVVCAGNIFDFNFLSRLKSIIYLSDFVISNDVGTHTGYVTYLNKAQLIYNQEIIKDVRKNSSEISQRTTIDLLSQDEEKFDIYCHFKDFSMEISLAQLNCIDFYFGLNQIKSSEQLKHILKSNS